MYVLVGLAQNGFKVLDTEDGAIDECSLDELRSIVLGGTKVYGITKVQGVHNVVIAGRNIISQDIRILGTDRNKFIDSIIFYPLSKAVSPRYKYYFRVGYTGTKFIVQLLAYAKSSNKIFNVFSFSSKTSVGFYNYFCSGTIIKVFVYTNVNNVNYYSRIDYDISTRKASVKGWTADLHELDN